MDNKNICSSCGTENEAEYRFCKNCGEEILIEKSEPQSQESGDYTYREYSESATEPDFKSYQKGIILDSISGIPSEEIALFVGKKGYDILPKFSKMELSNSKVSWCWPVAILGYLFGPFGAAFWFFYRKMYKPAFILSLIGAAVTIVTTIMTGGINIDFETIMDALANGDMAAYTAALQNLSPKETVFSAVASIIENSANIISCILCGLFGFYFYKKHCIEKISGYRAIGTDKRFYKMGLASIGGVSGGMVALGIVIMIMVSNFAAIITELVSI